MREIKFRAWDTINKKWLKDWKEVRWIDGIVDINSHLRLMQYTGLKDKHGIEIYEGDIVSLDDNWDELGWNAGDVREIYFGYGGFRLKAKRNPKAKGNWLEEGDYLEVIGNIYQDPKLLEVFK